MNNARKKALQGTYLLVLSALIAKILSAIYRIPFQNIVGNRGFYVYQQVYPIYGIGMTFALNGLPAFISKLVVEQIDEIKRKQLVHKLTQLLSILSTIIFLGLYIGASWLASSMGDVRLAPVIQSVSWMFLLMPFLSVSRGYYQGILDMQPTAYSQIVEQIVRVSTILLVAIIATNQGTNYYRIGQLAMLSAPIAGMFALLVMLPKSYYLFKPTWVKIDHRLMQRIIFEGGTLCLVTSVIIILQLVDSFSVINALKRIGTSEMNAQNIKGIYDRSQTLVQLGLVIGVSSATAILPSLTMKYKNAKYQSFFKSAVTSLHVNFALALTIWAGLVSLMPEINQFLFKTASLNLTISTYCFSIVLVTILTVYNSILQSQREFKVMMLAIGLGIGAKILLNQVMIVQLGILGASVTTIISLLVMLTVVKINSFGLIPKTMDESQLFKLLLVIISMGIIVRLLANGLGIILPVTSDRLKSLLILILMIPVGVLIFLLGSTWLKVFSNREWLSIPLMKQIIRLKNR